MLHALETYSKWMQHFTSPPIKWCPIKSKFLFSICPLQNFLWYFHTFVGLGFCTAGGVVVILLSQIFQFYPPVPLAYLFIFGIELATSGAAFAVNLGMILYGRECVMGWNALLEMQTNLQRRGRCHRLSTNPVWRILTVFVWAFTTYPFVVSVAGIVFTLDPFYYILSMFNITNPLLRIFRFYLIFAISAEMFRFLALIILFCTSSLIMLRDTLVLLTKETSTSYAAIMGRMQCTRVKSGYRQAQIITLSMEELLGYNCLFGHGLALVNSILFNFVSLKFYATLPIWFYVIFPSIAVIILITIHVMMPCLHSLLDNSKKLLETLYIFTACQCNRGRKGMIKELRSLKKITMSPMLAQHKFFIYTRSTKVTFLVILVTHTINLLLAVPRRVIQTAAHLF
ncbi:hypothetical protein Fcan01_00449 [Folsomia candida]|uniref:Uncharacterized protein n=1 Tax=Folsomia candida TaxID=158441 RepID=A0A226EVS2_FOLCA|nr:hypothetical protein Fcan01_00449 [Folsomia candida]